MKKQLTEAEKELLDLLQKACGFIEDGYMNRLEEEFVNNAKDVIDKYAYTEQQS